MRSRKGSSEPCVHFSDMPCNPGRLSKAPVPRTILQQVLESTKQRRRRCVLLRRWRSKHPSCRFFSRFQGERLWRAELETKRLPKPVRLLCPREVAAVTVHRKGVQVHSTYLGQGPQSTEKTRAFSAPDTKEFKLCSEPLQCQVHGGH